MTDDKKNSVLSNHEIHSFEVTSLSSSKYINPYRLQFQHNSQRRVWDVRQFRPVVYVNQLLENHSEENLDPTNPIGNLDWNKIHPNEGFTFELCAGICDKNISLEETIKEEILEECGFEVNLENIHKVRAFRVGVGLLGCLHTIFYAEVDESMKVSSGGGNPNEAEFIELFEIHQDLVRDFLNDDSKPKPPGLLYGLMWFLYEREQFFKSKEK
ncbi:unnamed protein product [Brachionus calyciflorus]|uniref:Uridine diphosphate glucose pyrophosphatase NUDT14 n=1 Tax=Brachionus calyciflorus TaxID=104777 RepID=A0A813MHH9_9BILA|nr:unnamed protein product [Brachionus calyciflorus]